MREIQIGDVWISVCGCTVTPNELWSDMRGWGVVDVVGLDVGFVTVIRRTDNRAEVVIREEHFRERYLCLGEKRALLTLLCHVFISEGEHIDNRGRAAPRDIPADASPHFDDWPQVEA